MASPPVLQFLKSLTLQSRAIITNLCQLLTPIILLSFAGIMQIVLNHVLSKNPAPVPGSESLPLPVDVGRLIVCNQSYAPESCHDEYFSALAEFDWQELPDDTNLTQLFEELYETPMPHQQLLFDLPFYYVGK